MTDTQRSLSTLLDLAADNTSKAISPQDIRDFFVSALGGYGSIYVEAGATPETVGTTPVELAAFAANGAASGVTPDHAGNRLVVLVAGDYLADFNATFTGTASREVRFKLRKNAAEVTGVPRAEQKLDAAGAKTNASFSGVVTCAANDVLEVYAEADVDATSLTIKEATLRVKRAS